MTALPPTVAAVPAPTGLRNALSACRHRTGLGLGTTLALLAIGLASAPAADAQGAVFSIMPVSRQPYFVFRSSPGSTVQGKLRVVNDGATTGKVALSAVDATTGQTSGAVYLSAGAKRRDVGRWLSLSAATLTLGPRQSKIVTFSVRVPARVRGGQHLGGLVAAPVQARATRITHRAKATFRVNIKEIAIVAVEVNLPGARRQRMSITSLGASGRPGYQTLLIGLANIGNTLVKGAGRLTVSTAGGSPRLAQSFALDTFVPHTSIAFPLYVRGKRLPPGRYIGTVTIRYGHGHKLRRTFGFTISGHQLRQTYGTVAPYGVGGPGSGSSMPAWALGLGAVALVGLSVGGSSRYFRRRAARS